MTYEVGGYGQLFGGFAYTSGTINSDDLSKSSLNFGLGLQGSVGVAASTSGAVSISVDTTLGDNFYNPFSDDFDFPGLDLAFQVMCSWEWERPQEYQVSPFHYYIPLFKVASNLHGGLA